jgi:recombination associated protein RdgC
MLLKNLIVHRLGKKRSLKADRLEEKLAGQALQPCSSLAMESRGWLPPRDEDERYVYAQHRHWLLALGVEQKILPASVVRQAAKDRAAQISAKQGRPVGRKELRDLRDRITNELMPRALARRAVTRAWVDEANGLLMVDAGADKKSEEFMEALRRADEDISAKRLDTQRSPGSAMTRWLAAHKAPAGFSIDQDLELQSADTAKSVVRYVNHALDGKDIQNHIAAGKTVTRLGLTWKDRISFVLTDQLHIRRLGFVDIAHDEGGDDASAGADEEERFAIDFALMTGELSLMLADLVAALGGEKAEA